jgi:hypothetical protein
MVTAAFLMLIGGVCVAVFVHLNLNVQPRLFPGEVSSRNGVVAPVQTPPKSHLAFGLLLAVLFFGGVALFCLGSAIIATTIGYGHAS